MYPAESHILLDDQVHGVYYHPFSDGEDSGEGAGCLPRPLNELKMMKLSATLRDKPSWWTKYKDPEIRSKWKEEALANQDGITLSEKEVGYVLDELRGYEAQYDPTSGIQVSCTDSVWQSDSLIPSALRSALISDIAKLEDIPENQKDWHPRSNNQVLDIVHPSLYPLVYGRTLAYPLGSTSTNRGELKAIEKLEESEDADESAPPYCISEKFAWIPTDFSVSKDGKKASALGYINNLHPSNASLYHNLDEALALFIPLFEKVLTDIYVGNEDGPLSKLRTEGMYTYADGKGYWDEEEEGASAWTRTIILPRVPMGGYTGGLEDRTRVVSLKGTNIQVIVKLANIHLTPENPSYEGGNWHVEGMLNEHIAASGIYYYSEENITESSLSFRTAVAFPEEYEQSDDIGAKRTWGFTRDEAANQVRGAVSTKAGRCIAFPNLFQHCVSPFKLVDPSRPGYRKILVFFLVDPSLEKPIPSTSIIPPQQKEWSAAELRNLPRSSGLNKLPVEVLDMINDEVGLMTRAEAEQYRLELMDERTKFVEEHDANFFSLEFDMCEQLSLFLIRERYSPL